MTADLKRRLKQHKQAKLGHRNKNFKLIFFEAYPNKKDALKREQYLKSAKGKHTLRMMLQNTLKSIE